MNRIADPQDPANPARGISPAALLCIGACPGLTVGELGHLLRVSPSEVSAMLERLVSDGMVCMGSKPSVPLAELKLQPAGERLFSELLLGNRGRLEEALSGTTLQAERELAFLLSQLLRCQEPGEVSESCPDRSSDRRSCRRNTGSSTDLIMNPWIRVPW